MTHGQQKKLTGALTPYYAAGGDVDVDGVPLNGAALIAALTCLGTADVESLMSDMATFAMMMEGLKDPNQYRPDDMAANSKATIHVSCSKGSWGVTWSK